MDDDDLMISTCHAIEKEEISDQQLTVHQQMMILYIYSSLEAYTLVKKRMQCSNVLSRRLVSSFRALSLF